MITIREGEKGMKTIYQIKKISGLKELSRLVSFKFSFHPVEMAFLIPKH